MLSYHDSHAGPQVEKFQEIHEPVPLFKKRIGCTIPTYVRQSDYGFRCRAWSKLSLSRIRAFPWKASMGAAKPTWIAWTACARRHTDKTIVSVQASTAPCLACAERHTVLTLGRDFLLPWAPEQRRKAPIWVQTQQASQYKINASVCTESITRQIFLGCCMVHGWAHILTISSSMLTGANSQAMSPRLT